MHLRPSQERLLPLFLHREVFTFYAPPTNRPRSRWRGCGTFLRARERVRAWFRILDGRWHIYRDYYTNTTVFYTRRFRGLRGRALWRPFASPRHCQWPTSVLPIGREIGTRRLQDTFPQVASVDARQVQKPNIFTNAKVDKIHNGKREYVSCRRLFVSLRRSGAVPNFGVFPRQTLSNAQPVGVTHGSDADDIYLAISIVGAARDLGAVEILVSSHGVHRSGRRLIANSTRLGHSLPLHYCTPRGRIPPRKSSASFDSPRTSQREDDFHA
ncbi:hypothetical protein EXIGLDRAFT_778408 [Exidia glandulosa HHB12029]|uniref:Uncharacterized protein n=1 Tax=Exidia glandulosa HHB12029 TaxID=1314781 RepID=A0A165CJC7_EXIGL|nr:hypothetical protein EXIGLDRAFT_778408 [Exidia glandulosa HHB12029]